MLFRSYSDRPLPDDLVERILDAGRVAGSSDGAPATYRSLASFEPSPEGLSAGAFGTAIPIATTVRWLAEGRVPPGVHPPETAFDPAAFVGDLEREGVGFSGELLV